MVSKPPSQPSPPSESSANPSYTMGHSEPVTRSHASRTVANSATFLLPHLTPTSTILDLGCGPGTITVGFAPYVSQGKVIGIDPSESVIASARSLIPAAATNISFEVGDGYALSFPDNTFDIVFAHQVMPHLPEPVRAMREAYRVLKPGGILATRDIDTFLCSNPRMDIWIDAIMRMVRHIGGGTRGRDLRPMAAEAGFDRAKMTIGAGSTVFASDEERKFLAGLQIERFETDGEYRKSTLESGTSEETIKEVVEVLKEWRDDPDGWHVQVQSENLYRK